MRKLVAEMLAWSLELTLAKEITGAHHKLTPFYSINTIICLDREGQILLRHKNSWRTPVSNVLSINIEKCYNDCRYWPKCTINQYNSYKENLSKYLINTEMTILNIFTIINYKLINIMIEMLPHQSTLKMHSE